MSLLKWKELAKSKTKLGNKINYVHNLMTQHKIGENTSQESFAKVFKPVTSKLDDVIDSNLNFQIPGRRKRPRKKGEVPDYGIDIEDEVEDMGLDDLFGDNVPPQQQKQMGPVPPPYEDIFGAPEDIPEPQAPEDIPGPLPEEPPAPEEPPPDYDYDEDIDYTLDDDDQVQYVLDDLDIPNFASVDKTLAQDIMTKKRKIMYLKRMIKNARSKSKSLEGEKSDATKKYNNGTYSDGERVWVHRRVDMQRDALKKYINHLNEKLQAEEIKGSGIKGRGIIKKMEKDRNRIKGYKAYVTKRYNSGVISEAERQMMNKQLDNKIAELNKYIKDHKKKIKGRGRKQRGGNVMFFNDVKQLLNKLELIIGEIIAGNTSIKMRNTGVNILDTLLRMSTINKPQYNKLYKKYFKV